MRRRYLFLLLCVGAVISWGIIASRPSAFSQSLAEGRNKWSTHQPVNYRMHVRVSEAMHFDDYRLTVRNGVVTDSTCESYSMDECRAAADVSTIPKLFYYAERLSNQAHASGMPSVQVDFQFDPTYGFPQFVTYRSTSPNVFDYSGGMEVTEFEVLP